MADLRIKSGTSSVAYGSDDSSLVEIRGTRDGAMVTAPWLTALALEGRCFGMNTGTGGSPDTFIDAYQATKPDAYIAVPAGTTIIPVYIEISWEDTDVDVTNPMHCMAVLSSVVDTSAGGTPVTSRNMRTDAPIKSLCKCTATVSTGTTPLTGNFLEFWRATAGLTPDSFAGSTAQTAENNSRSVWCITDALVPPVIVGAGSLSVHAGKDVTSAITGWITIIWAEVPSNSIV